VLGNGLQEHLQRSAGGVAHAVKSLRTFLLQRSLFGPRTDIDVASNQQIEDRRKSTGVDANDMTQRCSLRMLVTKFNSLFCVPHAEKRNQSGRQRTASASELHSDFDLALGNRWAWLTFHFNLPRCRVNQSVHRRKV
jgi:hypothetical protein